MFKIVGSSALQYFGLLTRNPKDVDVFTTEEHEGYCKEQRWDTIVVPKNILHLIPTKEGRATPDAVYTIKLSHLPYNIHWDKHWRDAQYLKKRGCVVIEPLYRALSDYWKRINGNKEFLSLNRSKQSFFNDYVTYLYDHDYLHELVAYPNKPIYLQCLKEGQDVLIDNDKLWSLPFKQQIKMFREEIGVIACERWLINPVTKGKVSWTQAWNMSVKKTITSLTKGRASEFLVRHMEYFIKPDKTELEHIFKTLNIGELNMGIKLSNEEVGLLKADIVANTDTKEWDNDLLLGYYNIDGLDVIEQDSGGEGGGESCYTILKWKDVFYKVTYSYYSYEGFEFDYAQWYIVTPKETIVTVYD